MIVIPVAIASTAQRKLSNSRQYQYKLDNVTLYLYSAKLGNPTQVATMTQR
jgi:hypothetical protein